MLRMIFAGLAAVAVGTIGGYALVAATPARDTAPQVKLASATTEIVPPTQKTDPAPVAAPKRTVEAAPPTPPPGAKAQPGPELAPADATPDKPEIRFDGDRVSVRFGKFKIDF
jgi:hypothetical protein